MGHQLTETLGVELFHQMGCEGESYGRQCVQKGQHTNEIYLVSGDDISPWNILGCKCA